MEEKLIAIVESNLLKVLEFNPYANFEGISSTKDFMNLMQADPAFAPFSLNREKYVAARFGGNLVTSLHRKLGDLYEELFITILSETFGFSKDYLKYSLELNIDGELQKRTTDGRIILADIKNAALRKKAKRLIAAGYTGFGVEVRSCYQIGDSKRIQADIHMANALKHIKIEPKMLVFCNSSLKSPIKRLSNVWTIYEGQNAFSFIKDLTDFDLFAFLMNNNRKITLIMDKIFDKF
jgi:hypothetical protein